MHGGSTRQERQLEKMEKAARLGKISINLTLFSNEAKRWKKRGLRVKACEDAVNSNVYTLSFDHYHWTEEDIKEIEKTGIFPKDISTGEYLYILARMA